jgi:hypothetical protein
MKYKLTITHFRGERNNYTHVSFNYYGWLFVGFFFRCYNIDSGRKFNQYYHCINEKVIHLLEETLFFEAKKHGKLIRMR